MAEHPQRTVQGEEREVWTKEDKVKGGGPMPRAADGKTAASKRAFLAALAECGNITEAARVTKINRATHYTWMQDDADYAQTYQDAMEQAGDRLEQEARRRALHGVKEPVFYKGEVCGSVQKYSDVLLIFLLKGAKPEKYADRSKVDANVSMKVVPLDELVGGNDGNTR